MPRAVPSEAEVRATVAKHSAVLQYKNSLKFIQGGTNMSLERMQTALDALCAVIYVEGYRAGLELAQDEVAAEVGKFNKA